MHPLSLPIFPFVPKEKIKKRRQREMQGASTSIGYGLNYQARCIEDVKADSHHTSFLARTLSLKEENEPKTRSKMSEVLELLKQIVHLTEVGRPQLPIKNLTLREGLESVAAQEGGETCGN